MTFRRIMLALFFVTGVGAGIELLLLGHTESVLQWIPLILLGAALLAGATAAVRPAPPLLRAFQGLMVLFVAAGLVGLYLHYKGNVEFELEMYPSLSGFALFREAVTGATPALAPAVMMQLGALGLAWTWRHPGFGTQESDRST